MRILKKNSKIIVVDNLYEHICGLCGEEFLSKLPTARWCSDVHRKEANRLGIKYEANTKINSALKKLKYALLIDKKNININHLPLEISEKIKTINSTIQYYNTSNTPFKKVEEEIEKKDVAICNMLSDWIKNKVTIYLFTQNKKK